MLDALLLQVLDISFLFVHIFGHQLIGNNFFPFYFVQVFGHQAAVYSYHARCHLRSVVYIHHLPYHRKLEDEDCLRRPPCLCNVCQFLRLGVILHRLQLTVYTTSGFAAAQPEMEQKNEGCQHM